MGRAIGSGTWFPGPFFPPQNFTAFGTHCVLVWSSSREYLQNRTISYAHNNAILGIITIDKQRLQNQNPALGLCMKLDRLTDLRSSVFGLSFIRTVIPIGLLGKTVKIRVVLSRFVQRGPKRGLLIVKFGLNEAKREATYGRLL